MFRAGRAIAVLFVLFCCSVLLIAQAPETHSKFPGKHRIYAPYVDMGKPANNLPEMQKASGVNHFTMAFIQAAEGCAPGWIAAQSVADDKTFGGYIQGVRAAGGDVIISFGGWEGQELAQVCRTVPSLQKAYQAVIDKYNVHMLDFDIEHTAIEDQASIDRRSRALRALAAANPGLYISFTLPGSPAGLTDASINVLRSAVTHRVPVSLVNIMTMDYSMQLPDGVMGTYSVASAAGANWQLKGLGLDVPLGITPMLGTQDTPKETFTLDDAKVLTGYAIHTSRVKLLASWSLPRDNGSCSATVSPACSGIQQQEWDFARIFLEFEKAVPQEKK